MRLKKFFSVFLANLYIIAALLPCFYRSTGIVAGMSNVFIVFLLLLVYWSKSWYGFPPFIADHGCQHNSSPTQWNTRDLIDDEDLRFLTVDTEDLLSSSTKGIGFLSWYLKMIMLLSD